MKNAAILAVVGFALLSAKPASATVIHSFDFNGNLSDTLGTAADLTSFGGSLSTLGRYTFDINEGLGLSQALPFTNDYSIEMKFQVNTPAVGAWNKLIDYENLTEDIGFYFHSPSPLVIPYGIQFYPDVGDGPDVIPLNTDVVVKLQRDALTNEVSGFLNGVEQWKFIDTFQHAVPSGNLLTFFVDDFFTAKDEAFAGSVDFIRISDNAPVIPEPNTFTIGGLLGLTFLVGRSWRRTKAV